MNSLFLSDSNKPPPTECTESENTNKLPRGLVGMKGLPVARGARLPSLRSPRDLTLGGAAKRVFTPNVSQCKERSKDNVNAVATVTVPEKSNKRNRQRNKECVYRKPKSRELIQTQGTVFGERPIDVNAKSVSPLFGKGYSRCEKKLLSKPVVPKSKERSEKKQMQQLFRDDFIDDDDDDNEDGKLLPVVLPINNRTESLHQNMRKKWIRIKSESDEEENSMLSKENRTSSTNNENTPLDVFSVDSESVSGKLLFFQFPDCLPELKEKANTTDKVEPIVETPGLPQKRKVSDRTKMAAASSCTLSDWPEGYIGKLRIHKSGRTYLSIGSLILDVNISTSVGFLQELVSLRVKNNTGDMTVLGHVSEKVVCVPSTEALIASCS